MATATFLPLFQSAAALIFRHAIASLRGYAFRALAIISRLRRRLKPSIISPRAQEYARARQFILPRLRLCYRCLASPIFCLATRIMPVASVDYQRSAIRQCRASATCRLFRREFYLAAAACGFARSSPFASRHFYDDDYLSGCHAASWAISTGRNTAMLDGPWDF